MPFAAKINLNMPTIVSILGLLFVTNSSVRAKEIVTDTVPDFARANESIMINQRALQTKIVKTELRWGTRAITAKSVCARNRHGAEWSGTFSRTERFIHELNSEIDGGAGQLTFYDSALLREVLRIGEHRAISRFVDESLRHGWPSFRASEVIWENVRVLDGGEVVTVDGLHLGHNLPDEHGDRFCINLVCVSGEKPDKEYL